MPRRILLLITDLEIGGTPTVVRELAWRLNNLPAVHCEVACLAEMGPVGRQLRAMGVPATGFDARGPRNALGTLTRLIDHVRFGRFDTVFSFLIHANAMAAAASVFLRSDGVRFFQSIQTTQARPAWHWRLQAQVHRRCERIAVPSSSVAQVAQERSGVPPEKLIVIPNALNPEEFLLPRDPYPGAFPVGFIGRLDPVKRLPDLLAAVRKLEGKVHLHVFGEGAERPNVEREIDRLQIRSWVTLHGVVPRPQEALRHVELLVLPSEAEGFGLVLIEAMAAGVPVVATDAPGIGDVVRHDETGLLVPVGSPDELADAIERVRTDAGLCERLVAAGRADVHERFTWNAVLRQYTRLLGI